MRIILVTLIFMTLNLYGQKVSYDKKDIYKVKLDDAIPVLNVATFHMRDTYDAQSTKFDEHDERNQEAVRNVAKLLAEFKPTIIAVEDLPENDSLRNIDYLNYVKNPRLKFKNPGEIELLAYEVGRLSDVKKIYGINFRETYNYNIADDIREAVDKNTVNKYWEMNEENEKNNPEDTTSFYQLFKLNNHPQYLENLIVMNADILTFTSSKGKSEGADEAAKFYHRNLVMFSNLNQIPVNRNDRIFILMGGTHTAFFNNFIKRSPKYKLVDPFKYLK
ncbi:DUF5694 domain-containing protein [Riemerella anatipestifer]|nr:DUF5694 domain-containing protein [Riemerella anatipestifer]MDY3326127.1 DUF5694 domain-containing protein [Riemerella anatipestifer]MDY3354477.1 DUF5694 domain-containing protein [Riemerella anatipestifer]